MNTNRKTEIEALLAQITPGEWFVMNPETDLFAPDICVRNGTTCGFDLQVIASLQKHVPRFCGTPAELNANAAFIAAAPDIIRELLTEVERLYRPACPKCASINVYHQRGGFSWNPRDGLQTKRWLCADCGTGFQSQDSPP